MYNQLKAKIDLYIRTNGVRAITGAILNEVLNDMVDGLGTNAGFGGSITPSSEAPTTDSNIFFIASTAGTYTNFSGIVVASGELAFIHRQGNGWAKDSWTISVPDISGKTDKVSNATSGNFAGLDANGNLTDSDSKASDFATASQGAKADTAYQKPLSGIPESDLSSDVQQALQKHFKGWFNTLAELKAAYTAVEGDSAYVKDASPATTWSIYVYDATATTDNNWADSGADADTSNVQTFESGEKVNETYIDDTHLVTPKDGALPKAEDILQLKAKLEGVTASETKVTQQPITGSYVKGVDGSINTASNAAYIEVAIGNNKKNVRFLGPQFNTTNYISGYAFGHYTDPSDPSTWVTDKSSVFDTNASTLGTKEYVIAVPEVSTHFRTTTATNNVPALAQNFYCYMQSGENVIDSIYKELKSPKTVNVNLSSAIILPYTIKLNTGVGYRTWAALYSGDSCGLIEVISGEYVSVTANSSNNSHIAFLDGFPNVVIGEEPNFVEIGNDDVVIVTKNTTQEFIVPNGAKYLYFKKKDNTLNYSPRTISVTPQRFIVEGDIVDNLDSDDGKNPLSAKQGKNLKSLIDALNEKSILSLNKEIIPFALSLLSEGTIDATTLKWSVSTGYYHCKVNVKKGSTIHVDASPNTDSRVALLPLDYEVINGSIVTFVDNTSLIVVGKNTSQEFDVSEDCCLYIQIGSRANSSNPYYFTPSRIIVLDKNQEIEDTWKEVDFYKRASNHLINSSGVVEASNTSNDYVKYYNVVGGKEYKLINRHIATDSYYLCAFYDNTDTFISGILNKKDSSRDIMTSVVAPNDAVLCIISYRQSTTTFEGGGLLMEPAISVDFKGYNTNINFVTKIRSGFIPNNHTSNVKEDITTEGWSMWALRLPQNYKANGKKTQLVGWFHGTHGFVNDRILGYQDYDDTVFPKLLNAGFAVMDIHGYGVGFASDEKSQHWGCPAAIETVKKAFEFLKSSINICDKLILGGISMGGAICTTYAKTYPNDVIAIGVQAPTNLILTCLYQSGDYVDYCAIAWGYDSVASMRNDGASNVAGYAPLSVPYIIDDNFVKKYPSFPATENGFKNLVLFEQFPRPIRIWQGNNDTNVPISRSVCLVNAINRAGGIASIRILDGFTHNDINTDEHLWVMDEIIDYYKTMSIGV